ncbi:MAG: hypothetical protein CMK59_05745 [Proteobacteria bacterium]|nr:hypothetical protein [Pseudomonadota bacterium]
MSIFLSIQTWLNNESIFVSDLNLREQFKQLSSQFEHVDLCSKSCFEPGHYTASVFLLSPDLTSILLIYHPTFQSWIQPGGHFEDKDDSLEAAAFRELKEETGVFIGDLLPILDLDIHSVPPKLKKNQPAHLHYDLRLFVKATQEQLSSNREISQAAWVSLSAFAQPTRSSEYGDASVVKGIQTFLAWREQALRPTL